MFHHPLGVGPLLGLSLLVALGYAGGRAARRLTLPEITGNIVAGAVVGPFGLGLLSHRLLVESLRPVSLLAFGFVVVSISFHLRLEELRSLRGSPLALALVEVLGSGAVVFGLLRLLHPSPALALLGGAMAATTAPATTLAVVREVRARGPLVSTLLPVIAFDNLLCVVLFTLVMSLVVPAPPRRLLEELLLPPLLGFGVGMGLCLLPADLKRDRPRLLGVSLLSLMVIAELADRLGGSPLLAYMAFGFTVANRPEIRQGIFGTFRELEPLAYVVFFTLAGTHLRVDLLTKAGALVLAFWGGRTAGKFLGSLLGAHLSGVPPEVGRRLGFGLLPQAGLAVGFVVLVQESPSLAEISGLLTAVVLSGVVLNELLGPLATRASLRWAGEAGRARRPLLGFLQEEDIQVGMEAEDKWEAISQLVRLLRQRKGLDSRAEGRILERVVERELSMTTGIGHGLAIPHGLVEEGEGILGAMGIFPEGVDFESLDGRPAHVVLLTAVPRNRMDEHLQALAEFSRVFGRRPLIPQLVEARTPGEAFEVLREAAESS